MATILEAAEDGDLSRVKELLDADPAAVNSSGRYSKVRNRP